MLLFNSGSLTEITYYLRYLDVLFKNSTISELIIPIISIFVHIVALCGLALVFHYKKIGFYIATIALGIIIILWIYNLYTYASTNPLFKTPYDIFNFIISFISSFGIIALYPILNIRQNGETIWPKMEISLTNTDWKSFFQYLLTFEMANLVIYLSNMV